MFCMFLFYSTGCPFHLMHIAAERAAKQLPVRVDDLLIDIFYHLEKSSKRKQEFRAFQQKVGVPQHKIIKHVSTKWLSLGQCLARLLEQWDALYPFFKAEKEKTVKTRPELGSSKKSIPSKRSLPSTKETAGPAPKRSSTAKTAGSSCPAKLAETSAKSKQRSIPCVASNPFFAEFRIPIKKTPAKTSAEPGTSAHGSTTHSAQCPPSTKTGNPSSKLQTSCTKSPVTKTVSSSKSTGKPSLKKQTSSKKSPLAKIQASTNAPPTVKLGSDSKPERVVTMMSNPNVKLYCLFLNKTIPLFEESNVLLQKDEPCIHRLHSVMCDQLRELLIRFVKPEVIASNTTVYEVDFANSSNQKSDDELFVGRAVREFIRDHGQECDTSGFYKSVRNYYVAACTYMIKQKSSWISGSTLRTDSHNSCQNRTRSRWRKNFAGFNPKIWITL